MILRNSKNLLIEFNVGDKVEFKDMDGQRIVGEFEGFNAKQKLIFVYVNPMRTVSVSPDNEWLKILR